MEKSPPTYKLAYSKCQRGDLHEGESLNFVCLNAGCASRSLICPICKTQEHVDHEVRPFKFYVEDLYKRFSGERKSDINDRLDELDRRRGDYLLAIEEVVRDLSEQFRKLEALVVSRFDTLKSEMLQEECLHNQFDNFYDAIAKEGHPQIQMLVQQFLPKKPLPDIPTADRIRDLRLFMHNNLADTIKFYDTAATEKKVEGATVTKDNPMNMQISPSIAFMNNLLVSKSDEYSMVLFGNKITPENHKLKIKIKSANPKLTVGVLTLNDFQAMKYLWNPSTTHKTYWINSEGKHLNATYNCMTSIGQNDTIDLSLKKGQLVVNNKKTKNYSTFVVKASSPDEWYFFLALANHTQVEVIPQKK